jgi:hypothetical protein
MTVGNVWSKIDTIQGYCDMINERKDFDDDSMDFIHDLLCEYKQMLLNLKIEGK